MTFDDPDSLPRPKAPEGEGATWLTSYADFITTLLVFFTLMITPQAVVSDHQRENKEKLDESLEKIEATFSAPEVDKLVDIEQNGNTAKITLKNTLLFTSGNAALTEDKRALFGKILNELRPLMATHAFAIQGHTDSVPIASSEFKSNWHLSTARALTILEEFIKAGFSDKRLSAQGFGSSRPVAPEVDPEGNDVPENRPLNRRVEILVQ